jgi:hypothetical protein
VGDEDAMTERVREIPFGDNLTPHSGPPARFCLRPHRVGGLQSIKNRDALAPPFHLGMNVTAPLDLFAGLH